MSISNTKRIGIKKYQQEKCDRITADIPKGKREEFKEKAARLGLSLSMLIQHSVESYGEGCEVVTIQNPENQLSTDEKKLLDEVSQLPPDAQRLLVKFLQSINRTANRGKKWRVDVYNLTVDEEHEYFANGFLVHNCYDAIAYAVMSRPFVPARKKKGWAEDWDGKRERSIWTY